MEKPIRINLGCGDKYWPGFLNLDSEVDFLNLPFKDGSVHEIHLIHVLEHLDRRSIADYLVEWRRVLVDGGLLVVEVPSLTKISNLVLNGDTNPHHTVLGLLGGVFMDNPLMLHKWCYTNDELQQVLTDAGFKVELRQPVFHLMKRDIRAECRRV